MTKRLAIIPARGGSKRIPDKNIRNFSGKPVISYILETVKNSNMFDVIHVSTDSEIIAGLVDKLGFTVDFMRPAQLSDDYTPIMPVLKYVLEEYSKQGKIFDQVWMFMPTAVFLDISDIIEINKLFLQSNQKKSILGVSEYSPPIEWAFTMENNGELVPLQPGKFAIRSQDLHPKYYDVGSFSLFTSTTVTSSDGAGNDNGFIGYVMPKYKAIDIDTLDDWKFSEALYKGLF